MTIPAGPVLDYLAAEHAAHLWGGFDLYGEKLKEAEAELVRWLGFHHDRCDFGDFIARVETVTIPPPDARTFRYVTFTGKLGPVLALARIVAADRYPLKWQRGIYIGDAIARRVAP